MLARIAASLLLLLAGPAAAASTFEDPMSFQGHAATGSSGWILGALDPSTSVLSVAAEAGPTRLHERLVAEVGAGPAGTPLWADQEPREHPWTDTPAWTADALAGPAAFVARLDAGQVELVGNVTWHAHGPSEAFGPDTLVRRLSTWGQAVDHETVLGTLVGTLRITGVSHAAEWYGLACTPCPTPSQGLTPPPGPATTVHRSLEVAAPLQWTLSATGTFAVTATRSDWLLQGAVRLPGFDGATATRTLQGATRLEGLAPTPDGRLRASVTGDWQAAFLDEGLDPAWGPRTAVAAGTLALAVAFVGLVAKEILAAPLTNERRRLLYRTVQERPGLHFQELRRATGFGNGALVYSLQVLSSAGLVASRRVHGRRHFYAHESVDYAEGDALLHRLAPGRLERTLALVQRLEPVPRARLVGLLCEAGESRASAYRLIGLLQESAVLHEDGGLRLRRLPKTLRPRTWAAYMPPEPAAAMH